MNGVRAFWYMALTQAVLLLGIGGFAWVLHLIGVEPRIIVVLCAFCVAIFSLCFAISAGVE